MVLLMESRLKEDEVLGIIIQFGFDFFQVVECNGTSKKRVGGLILSWKDKYHIDILSFSINNINGLIREDNGVQDWFFNGVYSFSDKVNKRRTWILV